MLRLHKVVCTCPESNLQEASPPGSVFSIAFGAPNICHTKIAQEINGSAHLRSHFFNVVHGEDPVHLLRGGSRHLIGERVQLARAEQQPRSTSRSNAPWNREMFSNCYKSALIAKAAAGEPRDPSAHETPKIKVDSPAPRISSAKRKASDSGIYISIKGCHLLFLREPVKLDGLYPWVTIVRTDSELLISPPNETKAEDRAVSTVVLKTAFGGTSHTVSEDIDEDPRAGPLRLLPKIVQAFFVLATPPLRWLPPPEVLEDLDSIIQCVPDLKQRKPSTLLKATADSKAKPTEEDRKSQIDSMNRVVEAVIDFLKQSYEIEYVKEIVPTASKLLAGAALVGTGLVVLRVGGVALAFGATSAAALAGIGCVPTVGGGGAVMAAALRNNRVMVREYIEMLLLATSEAYLWEDKRRTTGKVSGSAQQCTREAGLESLLQNAVERSVREFANMVDQIHKSETKDITLRHEVLKLASSKSKQNLLRRMCIVSKTVDMYNKVVKHIEFLGIVGAEDAGKSTFVKKAIQKFGEQPGSEDQPKAGMKCHTKTVRPYKLKGSFYLVDFPGMNGTEEYAQAWKQFTSIPSCCILLLDFQGDIKKDQVKLYQKMKKDLGSKVAVVFNKVDEMFTPRREREGEFNADYFSQQKRRTAEKLRCTSEDVHYVCLDPDPEEKLTKLRTMGVLGFEELAAKVGEWLAKHCVSHAWVLNNSLQP